MHSYLPRMSAASPLRNTGPLEWAPQIGVDQAGSCLWDKLFILDPYSVLQGHVSDCCYLPHLDSAQEGKNIWQREIQEMGLPLCALVPSIEKLTLRIQL